MNKFLKVFSATILATSIVGASSTFAAPKAGKETNPTEESTIGARALLLSQSLSFNGQGNTNFYFSGPNFGATTKTIRIYVKNTTSNQNVKFNLIKPDGTVWIGNWELDPGEIFLYETAWGSSMIGTWIFKFSTPDGSTGNVDVAVRDDI